MLYSPRWEHPKLADLIAWLETEDPSTKYDWADPYYNCLCARFLRSRGIDEPVAYAYEYAEIFGDGATYLRVGMKRPWTYGAALQRAKAEMA
jgi:hypothetical protein